MIRHDNLTKQHGRQLVFLKASAALQKGEKVKPVWAIDARKATPFRMLTGQEHAGRGAGRGEARPHHRRCQPR